MVASAAPAAVLRVALADATPADGLGAEAVPDVAEAMSLDGVARPYGGADGEPDGATAVVSVDPQPATRSPVTPSSAVPRSRAVAWSSAVLRGGRAACGGRVFGTIVSSSVRISGTNYAKWDLQNEH
jgi:hypothetical protein